MSKSIKQEDVNKIASQRIDKLSKKRSKNPIGQNEPTEFLLYQSPRGGVKVEVILNNETIWLTQQRMANMFGLNVRRSAII